MHADACPASAAPTSGLLTGRNSPYLSAVISMPFTPGHEVVGRDPRRPARAAQGQPGGDRPGAGLRCRAACDSCPWCAAGQHSRCDHITTGAVSAGIQTGFCADTGGGWSRMLVAHAAASCTSVPDALDDRSAVLVEPLACAIHSVRRVTVAARRQRRGGRRRHRRAAHRAGAARVHRGRPDLRRRQARPPARAGPGAGRDRGARVRAGRPARCAGPTGALPGPPGARRGVPAGRRRPRLRVHRRLRAWTPRCGWSGRAARSCCPACRTASVDLTPLWFRELQLVGAYASGGAGLPRRHARSRSRRRWTATSTRSTRWRAGVRRSATPAPRAGSAPSKSRSTRPKD